MRNGHTRRGKQRWRCQSCHASFVLSSVAFKPSRSGPVGRARQRVWFERWIKEGYSVRQLSDQSGHSRETLRRLIGYWLDQPPELCVDLQAFKYLVLDGSYLEGRQTAVVAIADPTCNSIVTGWYGVKEGGGRMHQLCQMLAEDGLSPRSVTIDGLPQVHAMVAAIWPPAAAGHSALSGAHSTTRTRLVST